MLRHLKFAVLAIVVVAGVLSPDGGGAGMVAIAAPMVVLYVFSIGLAWAFGRKKTDADDSVRAERVLVFLLLAADAVRRAVADTWRRRPGTMAWPPFRNA